jgi:hypothetical protein
VVEYFVGLGWVHPWCSTKLTKNDSFKHSFFSFLRCWGLFVSTLYTLATVCAMGDMRDVTKRIRGCIRMYMSHISESIIIILFINPAPVRRDLTCYLFTHDLRVPCSHCVDWNRQFHRWFRLATTDQKFIHQKLISAGTSVFSLRSISRLCDPSCHHATWAQI